MSVRALACVFLCALWASACATEPSAGVDSTPRAATGVPSPLAVSTAPPACATPPDGLICADPAPLTYAVVLDVIDGDTFDALVDGSEERVRLFGVDTPERGDPCYREATDALARLIGGEVRLRADARNRDSNGRLLRYVYTPEGRSIDAALISDGMAVAWTRDGALRDGMVALEQSARDAHRGCLWQ